MFHTCTYMPISYLWKDTNNSNNTPEKEGKKKKEVTEE